jgi:hypothetical protein
MAVQAFNKTSVDTIAIWMPLIVPTRPFFTPILLSTGVGVDTFINIDPIPTNVAVRPTINNALYKQVRQVIATGSFTFNPSSTALIGLRGVLDYQLDSHVDIEGIGLIINPSALLVDTYKSMIWTSPYTGANRGKFLSDCTINFSSRPPTAIALGGLLANPAIGSVLNSFGIF